jgi:hypothetical protein
MWLEMIWSYGLLTGDFGGRDVVKCVVKRGETAVVVRC